MGRRKKRTSSKKRSKKTTVKKTVATSTTESTNSEDLQPSADPKSSNTKSPGKKKTSSQNTASKRKTKSEKTTSKKKTKEKKKSTTKSSPVNPSLGEQEFPVSSDPDSLPARLRRENKGFYDFSNRKCRIHGCDLVLYDTKVGTTLPIHCPQCIAVDDSWEVLAVGKDIPFDNLSSFRKEEEEEEPKKKGKKQK